MRKIYIILLIGLISSALIFGVLMYMTMQFEKRPDTSAVVTQLQELSRFETASFTVEKIVDVGEKNNPIQDLLFGDRILLIAHGVAIAGFDLSRLSDDAIQVTGTSLRASLPPAQLLLVTLDNDKTQVYDRDTGIFSRQDEGLEREARLVAEDAVVQAACDAQLLETASENAISQLTLLFESMGFTEVKIEIPEATCAREEA